MMFISSIWNKVVTYLCPAGYFKAKISFYAYTLLSLCLKSGLDKDKEECLVLSVDDKNFSEKS